jgi:hypothetical protein
MLISRMVWLTWGSLISELDNFMISVDFCRDPVTFAIASDAIKLTSDTRIYLLYSPSCCASCVLIDPSLALLTDSLSICLPLLTTSFAKIRADLTSPFVASCLTVARALLVAKSNCNRIVNIPHRQRVTISNLPHLPIQDSLLCSQLCLPCTHTLFWRRSIEKAIDSLHVENGDNVLRDQVGHPLTCVYEVGFRKQ